MLIGNITLSLSENCEILLTSANNNISLIPGIFIFDVFNSYRYSGSVMHGGVNLIDIISNIKKFRVNGNRIGIAAYVLGDVLCIPSNPLDLFDLGNEIYSQILDFLPYESRIDILNSVIRREMIKITEIDTIIKDFDSSQEKREFTFWTCKNFGVMGLFSEIYEVLDSGKPDRRDLLASLIIRKKTGANLADIAVLRDYYRHRLDLDRLMYLYKKSTMDSGKDRDLIRKIENLKRRERKDFDFISLNLTKPYSEGILKDEFIELLARELNLMGITFNSGLYSKRPSEIPVSDLYKFIIGTGFITEKTVTIVDLSLNPGILPEVSEYIRRMKSVQAMACLYLCKDDKFPESAIHLFDSIVDI
ncbi:MAG: hypothetical protein RE471_00805 [Ferroplasma sp.]|uniref:hypothetical protein n=1 Tax=Ferroplasma sp. TaxID=2591003 RepID=UPI002815F26D|nr:hypothetical protein [Ferroplasma sp.]WMT51436.1 MAG: hypothetical protein RE471_00805 [Ferroplasma sp.]